MGGTLFDADDADADAAAYDARHSPYGCAVPTCRFPVPEPNPGFKRKKLVCAATYIRSAPFPPSNPIAGADSTVPPDSHPALTRRSQVAPGRQLLGNYWSCWDDTRASVGWSFSTVRSHRRRRPIAAMPCSATPNSTAAPSSVNGPRARGRALQQCPQYWFFERATANSLAHSSRTDLIGSRLGGRKQQQPPAENNHCGAPSTGLDWRHWTGQPLAAATATNELIVNSSTELKC
ncbi:hypothetical protein BP5796_05382 [Coleophoma crateriformis]|uniref:Uncharacterized protein n=1 Tax=Coleophoma crateriformis TaxID=565419 RepID=A0A3D8S3N5_9HELO|nr:hypothetical protein BP5796_05382 [Coleophoma crateriformis]